MKRRRCRCSNSSPDARSTSGVAELAGSGLTTKGSIMATLLQPHVIVLAYWLIMVVLAAFFLRLACSLCRAGIPTGKRPITSLLGVTFVAYRVFDYTCYLTRKSLDGELLRVPPWYSYSLWFREPIGLKWFIVSHAGFLRFIPIFLAVFAAGLLQFIV